MQLRWVYIRIGNGIRSQGGEAWERRTCKISLSRSRRERVERRRLVVIDLESVDDHQSPGASGSHLL